MTKKLATSSVAFILIVFQAQPAFGASSFAPALGQVLAQSVSMDGLAVPSGTTLLSKTLVATDSKPAAIQLRSGHLLELARHSSAYFEKTSAGGAKVFVRSGTLSYREAKGKIVTTPSESVLIFDQQREGRAVDVPQRDVVAVLTEAAPAGQITIKVNDVSKIDPKEQILIRSRDGKTQEVHYIESIQDTTIKMTAALKNSFQAQDLVIQGAEVRRAVAAGAAVVGTAAAVAAAAGAAAAGLSTAAIVGIAAGIAAAVTTVALVAAQEEQPASPTTP